LRSSYRRQSGIRRAGRRVELATTKPEDSGLAMQFRVFVPPISNRNKQFQPRRPTRRPSPDPGNPPRARQGPAPTRRPHDRPLTPPARQNWRFGPVSRTVRAVQRTAASPQGYVSQVACRPAPSSRIRRRDFLSRTSFVAQTRPGASGVVKFRYSQRGSRERWGHHAIVSFARPFRRARRVRASRTTGVPT